jgi:hypothetical protein
VSDLAAQWLEPKAERTSKTQDTAVHKPKRARVSHHSPLWLTLLPFVITAGTFVLSFVQQYRQHSDETQATRDSEWRKAIQQISSKESDVAIQGAYEMESFLDDDEHGPQALSITSALLPNVNDQRFFDIILFGLIKKANQNQENQRQFIALDVALATQLKDEYYRVVKTFTKKKRPPADRSFPNFLMHPDQFYSEDSESEKLEYVLTKTWELDSVSHGLAKLWNREPPSVTPDDLYLAGVILFNSDYSKVDFRRTRGMNEMLFVGNCKVNETTLPSGIVASCTAPSPAP